MTHPNLGFVTSNFYNAKIQQQVKIYLNLLPYLVKIYILK